MQSKFIRLYICPIHSYLLQSTYGISFAFGNDVKSGFSTSAMGVCTIEVDSSRRRFLKLYIVAAEAAEAAEAAGALSVSAGGDCL